MSKNSSGSDGLDLDPVQFLFFSKTKSVSRKILFYEINVIFFQGFPSESGRKM